MKEDAQRADGIGYINESEIILNPLIKVRNNCIN
jgi:hypothetical protein